MTTKHTAYEALRIAAERIGTNNYRNGTYKPSRNGYSITQAHRDVIQAMSDVLAEKITPVEAMALLYTHDVLAQRLGTQQVTK